VAGDVQVRNILLNMRGQVRIIDCDSFQITTPQGVTYPCSVGMEDFLAPELQGSGKRGGRRTVEQDNFAIAVIFFLLLFHGRHPFAGRPPGNQDMTLGEKIQRKLYAYSKASNRRLMPPGAQHPEDVLPAKMVNLFEQAFTKSQRPSAETWYKALKRLRNSAQKKPGKNKNPNKPMSQPVQQHPTRRGGTPQAPVPLPNTGQNRRDWKDYLLTAIGCIFDAWDSLVKNWKWVLCGVFFVCGLAYLWNENAGKKAIPEPPRALQNFQKLEPLLEPSQPTGFKRYLQNIQNEAVRALFNKAVTLGQQGKTGKALAIYEEIDRKFGQKTSPVMRELVASALVNKAVILWRQGKTGEEALAVYDEIDLRFFGQDASPGVREQVAKALFNKAVILWQQGKTGEEVLAVYEEIERRFGQDTSPGVRDVVAMTRKARSLY
jgi:tetratricopeptide (TPR) repeat protein